MLIGESLNKALEVAVTYLRSEVGADGLHFLLVAESILDIIQFLLRHTNILPFIIVIFVFFPQSKGLNKKRRGSAKCVAARDILSENMRIIVGFERLLAEINFISDDSLDTVDVAVRNSHRRILGYEGALRGNISAEVGLPVVTGIEN